jgi:hypothetical protein
MTERIVHICGRCAPAALAVYAGANLAGMAGLGSPLLLAAITLAVLVVCVAWWVHSRQMCEWCIGYVPVDSAAEVNRHRGSLHWCHHPRRRAITMVSTAGMLSAPLMPTPHLAAAVIAVFAFVCSVELRCEGLHRDLMPWCPWCRGGGETDETWTPDPTLAGVR